MAITISQANDISHNSETTSFEIGAQQTEAQTILSQNQNLRQEISNRFENYLRKLSTLPHRSEMTVALFDTFSEAMKNGGNLPSLRFESILKIILNFNGKVTHFQNLILLKMLLWNCKEFEEKLLIDALDIAKESLYNLVASPYQIDENYFSLVRDFLKFSDKANEYSHYLGVTLLESNEPLIFGNISIPNGKRVTIAGKNCTSLKSVDQTWLIRSALKVVYEVFGESAFQQFKTTSPVETNPKRVIYFGVICNLLENVAPLEMLEENLERVLYVPLGMRRCGEYSWTHFVNIMEDSFHRKGWAEGARKLLAQSRNLYIALMT